MTNSHLKHIPIYVWIVTGSHGYYREEWHHDNELDATEQYLWLKDMGFTADIRKETKTILRFE